MKSLTQYTNITFLLKETINNETNMAEPQSHYGTQDQNNISKRSNNYTDCEMTNQ